MSLIQSHTVAQVLGWRQAHASLARGLPCFFAHSDLGFGNGWLDPATNSWNLGRILRDTGRRPNDPDVYAKHCAVNLSSEVASSQATIPATEGEDSQATAAETLDDGRESIGSIGNNGRRRSVRATAAAWTTQSQQTRKRHKASSKAETEFEDGDENDPSILITSTCSAGEHEQQGQLYLKDFFCHDDSRKEDECWNFCQDDRARANLRSSDFYPLESGDLLSLWDDQCDKTSSHQFICAACAPSIVNKKCNLLCPGDEAVLKRRAPPGVTTFIRLFPGQVGVQLLVTIMSEKDVELICRDWRSDTPTIWTSLPLAPFVKAYEIRLEQDQILILPEGSFCAIRASDPHRRVIYYSRLAVFPDLGGANFVLNIFDESSSFSQKVVLWNAAHRLNDWLERVLIAHGNHCTPEWQARIQRLKTMTINVRQCVAHLAVTVLPPDPDWDWRKLVADLDLVIAQT